MNRFGKVIAVALAATMVFGSAFTSFATEPVTSVDSTGEGSSEGHVEKKTIDITLPTVASGSTPFKYIMDPERLISETAAARYANTVWPDEADDTGVYFNQGTVGGEGDDKDDVVYGKDSVVTTITNKSSHVLNITVKAEATTADTDIPLVAESALENASAASLYLGLVVGSEDPEAILADTAAEITVPVAGTPANYIVDWNATKSLYEYRALTYDEWKAITANAGKTEAQFNETWATTSFNLEGAVTEDLTVTSTTTAPEIKVTWSWADPDAAPTTYVVTYHSNYTDGPEDATEDVEEGGTPEGPSTEFTTREGYTLAGWATTADGEAAALTTYEISAATELFAIWTQNSAAPSIAVTEYEAVADTPIEITVDLGVGAEAADGIASITYLNKSGATRSVDAETGYTFSGNKITLTAATVNAFVDSSNDTRDYTITFDDDADTAVVITLTK